MRPETQQWEYQGLEINASGNIRLFLRLLKFIIFLLENIDTILFQF